MERAGDQPRLSGLARLTRPLLLSRTLCCHLLPVSRHVAADWAIFDQLISLRLSSVSGSGAHPLMHIGRKYGWYPGEKVRGTYVGIYLLDNDIVTLYQMDWLFFPTVVSYPLICNCAHIITDQTPRAWRRNARGSEHNPPLPSS